MQKISKEELEKKIAPLKEQWFMLCALNQIMNGFLELSITRLEEAVQSTREYIIKIIGDSLIEGDIKIKLIAAVQKQRLKEKDFENIAQYSQELSDDLKALLTLLKHMSLIIERLKKSRDMIEVVKRTASSELKEKEIKDIFLKYSLSLQNIWKDCEALCEAYDETVLFNKIIYKKELAVES